MAAPIPKNMLFSLNGIDFAAGYGSLVNAHQLYGAGASTMAYWSETDGGGRFTVKTSQAFIAQLKQWMKTEKFKSGIAYNSRYGKWKYKVDNREWMLTGNVYNNIAVIWRGKHGRTVGIRRDVKVPRIGLNGKQYGTISIAAYAAINEWGLGGHPARPLFRPAMEEFVARRFPPMVKMMKRALILALKKEGKKISPAESVGSASNTISQASLSGMSKVAGSNPDADFKAQAIQVIAANLGSKKATGSSKGIGGQSNKWARGTTRPTGNSAMKYSEEVLDSWMKANGYTEDDLYTPALDISGLQVKFGGIK